MEICRNNTEFKNVKLTTVKLKSKNGQMIELLNFII